MKASSAYRALVAVATAAMLVLAAVRCSHVTELVVSADGDIDADEIAVVVESEGTHENPPPARSLPATLGVSTDTAGRRVTISVVAKKGGVEVARRTRSTGFVDGERRLVEIPLCKSCAGITCPAGQECAAGACVSTDVPPAALPSLDGDPPRVTCTPRAREGGGPVDDGAVLFASPAPGAIGRRLYYFAGALLYQWDVNGHSTISSVRVTQSGGGDAGPVTLAASSESGGRTDVFASSVLVTHFKVDSSASFAVIQAADGKTVVIDNRGSQKLPASAIPPCTDLDVSYRTEQGFCRTAGPNGTLVRWNVGNGAPAVVASDLPPGDELVDATSGRTNTKLVVYSDPAAGTIWSRDIDKLSADGGAPAPVALASGQIGAKAIWSTPDDAVWMTDEAGHQTIKTKDIWHEGPIVELVGRDGIRAIGVAPGTVYFAANVPGDPQLTTLESVPWSAAKPPTVIRSGITPPVAIAPVGAAVVWLTEDARLLWAAPR